MGFVILIGVQVVAQETTFKVRYELDIDPLLKPTEAQFMQGLSYGFMCSAQACCLIFDASQMQTEGVTAITSESTTIFINYSNTTGAFKPEAPETFTYEKIAFKATGNSETILGYRCLQYTDDSGNLWVYFTKDLPGSVQPTLFTSPSAEGAVLKFINKKSGYRLTAFELAENPKLNGYDGFTRAVIIKPDPETKVIKSPFLE